MKEILKYLPGAQIHRGFRFPFGGWLELRHKIIGKFAVLNIRAIGKPELLLSPTLPKVNSGWCSAAENFFIAEITVIRNTVICELRSHEKERKLIFELYTAGNTIITEGNFKIIWLERKSEDKRIGSIYPIDTAVFETIERLTAEMHDRSDFDKLVAIGENKFHHVWDDLLNREAQKKIKSELKSLERTLKAIRQDYKKLGNANDLRHLADTIMANLHTLSSKQRSAQLVDPYNNQTVEIEFGLHITPVEYAQKLYSRARRAERGRIEIIKRYREILLKKRKLFRIRDLQNLETIAKNLGIDRLRLLGEPVSLPAKKTVDYGSNIKRFISSDGFEILVGRSSEANNRLTFELAAKDDYWFHAQNVKGAHVVLRTAGKNAIPKKSIEEAASLAAFYSDSKHSSLAPVIFAFRKYVHPIKHKQGQVRLDRCETIMVKPKERIAEKKKP